ncbi:hypothetical protein AB0G04_20230 [Actinoplanes sp. NPDC023801]|uniref:mechanosensitive ion channel family protein n=1 Tax=Actinoplanes sp. NPDC023801 TaxID=3154595 RepID=UPI0033E6E73A
MTGDGLSRGLSDMWRSVVLFLPSALAFLAIVMVGYLLARLARTLTTKALRRTGFDRAVQQGPAGRLIRPGTPSATDVCARLAFFVVLLFALQLAFGVWGPNPAGELINDLISWLPQVFVAIVIVVVTTAIARAAHDLTLAVLGNLGYARVLAKAVTAVIITLGVIAGLDQIGIATSVTRPLLITILATVAGVIIVGVGGGLIRPMQQRWDGWLDRAAAESAVIRSQARAYAEERARKAARPTGYDHSSTAGPSPTDLGSADLGSSGPGSADLGSSGLGSADLGSTGPGPSGPGPSGPGSTDPGSTGPSSSGSGSSGRTGPGGMAGLAGKIGHPSPAGADDVTIQTSRASSADRPSTAQAVAAGAAVTGVRGQEEADAPGRTADLEARTSGTAPAPPDGSAAGGASAGAPAVTGAVAPTSESLTRDDSGSSADDGLSSSASDGSGTGSVATSGDTGDAPSSTAAGTSSDAPSPAGGEERGARAGGIGSRAYPEEGDDWGWEARWAEEERQSRARGGDETQIVDAPAAGMVDDRPHMIPGFDRPEDRQPATYEGPTADEDPTIFVHIGSAETTLLTPGVRPAPASADPAAGDDDPTDPGHRLNASAVPDAAAGEPTRQLNTVPAHDPGSGPVPGVPAATPDRDEPTTSVVTFDSEPTTSFVSGGPVSGEPTVVLAAGGPHDSESTTSFVSGGPAFRSADGSEPTTSFVSGEPTVSLTVSGPDDGDPTTSFVLDRPVSGEPTVSVVGDGEPTTSFVLDRPVSGEPTVSVVGDGSGGGEPTTSFVVRSSRTGEAGAPGSDSDSDESPTAFITMGPSPGDEVVVIRESGSGVTGESEVGAGGARTGAAGEGAARGDDTDRTVESRRPAETGAGPEAGRTPGERGDA